MKKQISFSFLLVFLSMCAFSQEKIEVPELTADQKQQVLYDHMVAYAVSGISFAKSLEITPHKYGKYVGDLFTPYWDPAGGLTAFASGLVFILNGLHPDNQMQILEQSEKAVIYQLKNVDLPFRNGPLYGGVTYDEYLQFSDGILTTLAEHMNLTYLAETTPDKWYKVTLGIK